MVIKELSVPVSSNYILIILGGGICIGCGEHLVRTILARECSRALQTEDAHQALLETMQNKFISKYTIHQKTA